MKRLLLACLLFAAPLRAEVVDLTEHTSLSGAYLVPQPHAEFVTVQVLLNVGEADYDGPEGLAHYLEHLVWYSADKAHGTGQKNRISNAWVNSVFTNYWNASEPNELDRIFATVARVFEPLSVAPKFAKEERDIVEREFDFRTVDNAGQLLANQMFKTLLPGHALSRSTIGNRESLAQITPEMAEAFKAKWYWPNNATLLVSGPVNAADIVPQLKRHLGALEHSALPSHPWSNPITWDKRALRTTFTHPKVSEPFFGIHLKAPAPPEMPEALRHRAVQVLHRVLDGSTKSSPRTELYYNGFILSRIDVFAWYDKAGTINLFIDGVPEEDVSIETALAETQDYFARLSAIPQEEFAQVSNALLEQITREKRNARFEREIAFRGITEQGVPLDADAYVDKLGAVTPADLSTLLKAFQTNSISVTGIAYPKD